MKQKLAMLVKDITQYKLSNLVLLKRKFARNRLSSFFLIRLITSFPKVNFSLTDLSCFRPFSGVVYLPALVIGTILGSFIVKHWKLSVRGISRLALCSLSGTLLFSIPIMFIGCETIATAGVTEPYPNRCGLVCY